MLSTINDYSTSKIEIRRILKHSEHISMKGDIRYEDNSLSRVKDCKSSLKLFYKGIGQTSKVYMNIPADLINTNQMIGIERFATHSKDDSKAKDT